MERQDPNKTQNDHARTSMKQVAHAGVESSLVLAAECFAIELIPTEEGEQLVGDKG